MFGLNILVIDDELAMRDLLRRLLEREGHSVVIASDGLEGISAFKHALSQNKSFDLVITDFGMPQMNGGQVAKAIKSLSPSTPVILISGWDSRSSIDDEILAFVDWILDKPTTKRDLQSALKKVMVHKLT
ncbi:MAG: response regulator [Candidatus Fervidibacter sp.]|uniref:response regulator n=1 Tax=Candidatus Fervidibacter sp. TaxID=3100871 RepID=UPI00404B336A